MEEDYFRKIATTIIFALLIILSFILLKQFLITIILGVILAFIFLPIYKKVYKHSKLKNFSASLVCFVFLAIIFSFIWYFTPLVIDQSVKVFIQIQQLNFVEIFEKLFPSIAQSDGFSSEMSSIISSFVNKSVNSLGKSLSDFIINIFYLFIHFVIILFVFFFVLRDHKKINSYIRSLIPFSKEVQDKLFKSSKDITNSVIYGRIAMGLAQGIIVGIGFFIFGVPNALLLTVLAAFAGILPIIGTVIVWVPVSIFLFVSGNNLDALGIILFGVLSTIFESVIQPIVLARMVKMNSSIMLIGMVEGILMFGIMGVILGPLILAYLLIVLDIYRDKRSPNILTEKK
jgi:predicted PurR-regulated permease PerM